MDFIFIKQYLTKRHASHMQWQFHVLVRLLGFHFAGDNNVALNTFRQRVEVYITNARQQLRLVLRRGTDGILFPVIKRPLKMRNG
jgi:hypothetical protein